jgi:photosystem II PsbU protein
MKRLVSLLAFLVLLVGCLSWVSWPQQAIAADLTSLALRPTLVAELDLRNAADAKLGTEFGKKIDLNNTNVRAFRKYPGFYPTIAYKVVSHAPYEKVEDVLKISGLTDDEKKLLEANLDKFAITAVDDTFVEGGDRYNNGYY